ncbi:MAG: hypothetical protein ACRDHZ_00280 [Ktedonobacteraceae bacterium]
MHKLYSIGYLNPRALDLLQERVNQSTIILDIRLVAALRFRPDFSRKRLHERFRDFYQRVPEQSEEKPSPFLP